MSFTRKFERWRRRASRRHAHARSRFDDLREQLVRDPDGHLWSTGQGDRQMPPWFLSDTVSEPPAFVTDVLHTLVGERRDAGLYEVRFNWYDRTFELVKWAREWGETCVAGLSAVTLAPLQLDSRDAAPGWAVLARAFDDWAQSLGNRPLSDEVVKAMELIEQREHARRELIALSDLVRFGKANHEQLARYEWATNLLYPDRGGYEREAAEKLRPAFRAEAERLGL